MSLAPGPLIYLIYKYGWHFTGKRLGLTNYSKDITLLFATFSFTMLGVLATIVTILVALSDKLHFRTYRHNNHLDEFWLIYALGMICLFSTFMLAVINLAKNAFQCIFDLMVVGFIDSVWITSCITVIVINVLRHTLKESMED